MPLNLGTGSIKDFVKFNSKSDKWYVGGDQEISRPIFIADFDNIAIGWLRFREGQAPERCIFPRSIARRQNQPKTSKKDSSSPSIPKTFSAVPSNSR